MSNRSFTPSLFGQLPLTSRDEMLETLTPFFPPLWDAAMATWDEFLERRASDKWFSHLNEEQSAVALTTQMNYRLQEDFEGREGVRIVEQHRKPVFVFNEALTLTVKKVTRRFDKKQNIAVYQRSNYPTKRTKNFWDQRVIPATPELPRFMLGYQFLKEITEIKLFIAYSRSRGNNVAWTHSIPEPTRVMKPQLSQATLAPDVEPKGYEIVARNIAEEGMQS